jgi:hypothetical protein
VERCFWYFSIWLFSRAVSLLYSARGTAEAYANIDNTDYWEHRYFDATTGLTSAMHHLNPDGSQTTLAQIVFNIVTPTYEPTEQAVVKAIGALGRDPIP